MGICSSSNKGNSEVDHAMKARKDQDEKVFKLLLLGAGESGKSTLFRQSQFLYGVQADDATRAKHVPFILNNIFETLQTLIEAVDYEMEADPTLNLEIENEDAMETVNSYNLTAETWDTSMVTMTAEQVAAVQELWADPAIQHCWTYRNKYHGLVESVAYFIGKVEEIGRPGWIPTHDDLLRTRVRTTGIVEEKFVIRDARGSTTEIVMLDVGGQRSERKKWIHCFDNVTAILFVASLSGYDQTLFEDHKINRMKESLLLFENIVNNSYFENTTIILFLNKHDLFQEKIEQKVPLSIAFPEYTGDNSHDDALEFIKQKFLSQRQQKDREIVAHTTCATDTTIMSRIMDAVIESVIKARFRELNG